MHPSEWCGAFMWYIYYVRFKIFILLCSVILSHYAEAQNMVPNPGFEAYENCPTSNAQIYGPYISVRSHTVESWQSPTQGSPDYFNTCAVNTNVHIPNSFVGKHPAHSGNAFGGLVAFFHLPNNSMYYEYLQCRLTEPMIAGKKYEIACYVMVFYDSSITPSSGTGRYAVKELNASFSTNTNRLTANITGPLTAPVTPLQKTDKSFLNDTGRWVKVSGIYTAAGGEEWLTLGMFSSNPESERLQPLEPTAPLLSHMSYYIFDDIYVGEQLPCDTFVSFIDTLICNLDSPFTQFSSNAPAGYSYIWNNGSSAADITVNKNGTYWCTATSGCSSYLDTFRIAYAEDLSTLKKSIYDTTVCEDISLTIGTQYNLPLSYKWNTGDTGCCITPIVSGLYSVTIAADACNSKTDSADIQLVKCTSCLFIPDAFTPNADGLNDRFRAISSCPVNSFILRIYNRWGQQVFSTQDISIGWNGMHGASIADVGTYYYYIKYTSPLLPDAVQQKGSITLIR